MRGMQTIADAFTAAFAEEGVLSEAPAALDFQTQLASEMLERRAKHFGMSSGMVDSAVRTGRSFVSVASEWCETPIEKRLLPWLVFADYGDNILSIPASVHSPKRQIVMPEGDVVIVPQFAFAKYRMDFAVVTRVRGVTRIVCVECDGAFTHDDSHDAPRDEYLAAWNIPTVRATGKEIHNSPISAIGRVTDAVRTQLEGV